MDDPKRPSGFQENQEQIKNRSLKVKFKSSKAIPGWCKEESHLQEKDQNSELKSDHKNLKNHLQSSSVDQENRKHTHTATEESVHGGNLKINSEKITCLVCGKNFLSVKSISGHMRLHPERHWRGIKPPPTLDSSMVKIEDQQQNSPKGWSKTEKRGRISDELDVAYVLLELRIGNSLDLAKKNKKRRRVTEGTLMVGIEDSVLVLEGSDLPKKRRNENSELGNSEFQCKKPNIHQENENSRAGFNSKLVKMDPGLEISNGFEEFWGKNSRADQQVEKCRLYSSISRNSISLKSENLMKKFCELDKMNYNQTPMSSNRFECITCNKSFPSFQALGGHKSSHRNYKNSNNHKADVEEFSLANADRNLTQVDELQEFKSIMTKNVETHQCKICDKTFSTGQALGGHQRLHRPGPTRAPTSSVSPPEIINKESPMSTVSQPEIISKDSPISSVTLVEGASNIMERKFVDIDLNELPPHDECFE